MVTEQSIETLWRAGSAIEHAQMSWPLQIKIQLGTRVSQNVGPQAKTTMTLLICLSSFYDPDVCAGGLNYHCSRLFLSFCHIVYVVQAEPGSEARRNAFSVPCVLHTIRTVIWVVFLSHVCVWVHYCMLWAWCEDVVMTTVANDPKSLLLSYFNIDTIHTMVYCCQLLL